MNNNNNILFESIWSDAADENWVEVRKRDLELQTQIRKIKGLASVSHRLEI